MALFSPNIHVPLAPFMGIVALAPANPVVGQPGVTVAGVQSSGPPEGLRAETRTHYILMRIDLDLDRAMRMAASEVVSFLEKERGLTPAKALSLASLAVNFHIAEVVDRTQVVAGKIPKSLFLER